MREHGDHERGPLSLERGLVSIVVGLVVAVLVIVALEPILQRLYPSAALNPLDAREAAREASGSLPLVSSLLLLGAYTLASFAGGLASSLTAGAARSWPTLITGAGLMLAGTYGTMGIHPPLWFWIASLFAYATAGLGHFLARRSPKRLT